MAGKADCERQQMRVRCIIVYRSSH
jgi:hypothetical protein